MRDGRKRGARSKEKRALLALMNGNEHGDLSTGKYYETGELVRAEKF